MNRLLIFFLFFSLLYPFSVLSDDENGEHYIFWEPFEDDFPPFGWTHISKNIQHTWQKVKSAANGQITDYTTGNYFVYVSGSENEIYDEILITHKISNSNGESCGVYLDIACEPGYSLKDDFNFAIYISYDYEDSYNANWEYLTSLNSKDHDKFLKCNTYSNYWQFNKTDKVIDNNVFWLQFKYNGTSGTGIAIDNIHVNCEWADYNGDYGNDDDDTPADDSDDTKEEDCNCGLTFHDPAAPLALLMVLIGVVSLLISKRRFHL